MNVVIKAQSKESVAFEYASPVVRCIYFQSEGPLCASVTGSGHDDFVIGGEFDL